MQILFKVEDLFQIKTSVFDKGWRVIKVRARDGMKKSLILNQAGKKFYSVEEAQDFIEKQKDKTSLKRRQFEADDTDEISENFRPTKAKNRSKGYSKEDLRIDTLEMNHIRSAACWKQRIENQKKCNNKRNKMKTKKTRKLKIVKEVFDEDELILGVEEELLKEFDVQEENASKRCRLAI